MREIKDIVVHATGGSQTQTVQSLRRGWRALGWKNDGYHILIDVDGNEILVTPLANIANGVAGFNRSAIHVAYIGGLLNRKPADTRTDKQKATLIKVIKDLKVLFPKARVRGHRDFSPDKNRDGKITSIDWVKFCPCFDAAIEYKNL